MAAVVKDQGVRFSDANQVIEPEPSAVGAGGGGVEDPSYSDRKQSLTAEQQEEIRNLSLNISKSHMQSKRMENFAYDPVSLPASRVPSNSSSRHGSDAPSPTVRAQPSPPLTPSASSSRDPHKPSIGSSGLRNEPQTPVTPERSPSREPPPLSMPSDRYSTSDRTQTPHSAAGSQSRKTVAASGGALPSHPKNAISSVLGPTGDSLPPSEGVSPSATPGATTPSGAQTPTSRPFTPSESTGKSPRPSHDGQVDPKFIFAGARDRPKSNFIPGQSDLPGKVGSGNLSPLKAENKRHSFFSRHDHHKESNGHQGSMSDLKRFFKFGSSKKDKDKSSLREKSPSRKSSSRSGTLTPPSRAGSTVQLPFAEEHGLEAKYGKFGKVLGSGAGGSVRIMKRAGDGTTFAVKQFRDRHSYESEKEYNKKVTAEFCIGSTLHHGNIIETMDIIHEKGKWYEIMEYAPFDLFAIVMTGKMTREEVCCCTLQILSGVVYLHQMGLAHRDLKLDNVVVNEHGIMKIIDFGSAAVFRYPFEEDIVLATGIVGSDPYLAPEVYDQQRYDPRPTDIWSLAIIFCCMTLRRFPWKAPRTSDNSYRLFVTEPTEEERRLPGYPSTNPIPPPASTSAPASRRESEHADSSSQPGPKTGDSASSEPTRHQTNNNNSNSQDQQQQQQQPTVIKGPWRLLRLLPRESRHIIGKMLEIDPAKRATMDEILRDPWIKRSFEEMHVCRQEVGIDNICGQIVAADDHVHTLVPGGGDSDGGKK